jgi:hypothetical protein
MTVNKSELDLVLEQNLNELPQPTPRTLKQTFSSYKSIEDIKQQFIFYSPITYYLATDGVAMRALPTDLLSNTLAIIQEEHPLVITDLANPLFTLQTGLPIKNEYKGLLRTVYVVPREIWVKALRAVELFTAMDAASWLYLIFKPAKHTIRCPFAGLDGTTIDVEFLNSYSNKLIYYFTSVEGQPVPQLQCYPSVRELADMGNAILETVTQKYNSTETKLIDAAALALDSSIAAAFKPNKPPKHPIVPTMNDSFLTPQVRKEVDELIKMYIREFGDPNNPDETRQQFQQ